MKILIHGINFLPEIIGIGKYSGEMAEWLATRGHEVRVVTAPPYYPQWRIKEESSGWRYRKEKFQVVSGKGQLVKGGIPVVEAGNCQPSPLPSPGGRGGSLVVYRCPLWVPRKPSGMKRLVHLASFAFSSMPVMLQQIFWRPDVVWVVGPTLLCTPGAWLTARLCGAKAWLHIQDFEVDMAFDLGIIRSDRLKHLVLRLEKFLYRRFDRVSTISNGMLQRLGEKGVNKKKRIFFPNWVDTKQIYPLAAKSTLRNELGIDDNDVVALYSGSMGEKQGLEVIIEAANRLKNETMVRFIMCGNGGAYERLRSMAKGLTNISWLPLQPVEELNDLLNAADMHLLPQRADAADLVMPSKLIGMLASGRPVVATANTDTELWRVMQECGMTVAPGDAVAFTDAIVMLANNPDRRKQLGASARQYAEDVLDHEVVLSRFENALLALYKCK